MACICHNIYASQNRNNFNSEAKFNSETQKYTGKIIYTNAYFIYLEIDPYFLKQIKKQDENWITFSVDSYCIQSQKVEQFQVIFTGLLKQSGILDAYLNFTNFQYCLITRTGTVNGTQISFGSDGISYLETNQFYQVPNIPYDETHIGFFINYKPKILPIDTNIQFSRTCEISCF